jgi:hypothetical protein
MPVVVTPTCRSTPVASAALAKAGIAATSRGLSSSIEAVLSTTKSTSTCPGCPSMKVSVCVDVELDSPTSDTRSGGVTRELSM